MGYTLMDSKKWPGIKILLGSSVRRLSISKGRCKDVFWTFSDCTHVRMYVFF